MRKPNELPKYCKNYNDYNVPKPIYGYEYLIVPDDDIRWQYLMRDKHPPEAALPIVFFEVLANRYSFTSDISAFSKKLPLPIQIRSYFHENPDELFDYINNVFLTFPSIISRAGFLSDDKSLSEKFSVSLEKEDLASLYSNMLLNCSPKDAAPLGERLAKLKGWDAPEVNVNLNSENSLTQISDILNSLESPRKDSKFMPLPNDYKKLD